MKFTNHIVPADYKKHKSDETAIAALIAIAKQLKMPYSIKGSFKVYGASMESCTVMINTKSFTDRSDRPIFNACKAAIYYCIDTFAIFADQKKYRDEILKEEDVFCEEVQVGKIIPQ